jgi:hypothetical protein
MGSAAIVSDFMLSEAIESDFIASDAMESDFMESDAIESVFIASVFMVSVAIALFFMASAFIASSLLPEQAPSTRASAAAVTANVILIEGVKVFPFGCKKAFV